MSTLLSSLMESLRASTIAAMNRASLPASASASYGGSLTLVQIAGGLGCDSQWLMLSSEGAAVTLPEAAVQLLMDAGSSAGAAAFMQGGAGGAGAGVGLLTDRAAAAGTSSSTAAALSSAPTRLLDTTTSFRCTSSSSSSPSCLPSMWNVGLFMFFSTALFNSNAKLRNYALSVELCVERIKRNEPRIDNGMTWVALTGGAFLVYSSGGVLPAVMWYLRSLCAGAIGTALGNLVFPMSSEDQSTSLMQRRALFGPGMPPIVNPNGAAGGAADAFNIERDGSVVAEVNARAHPLFPNGRIFLADGGRCQIMGACCTGGADMLFAPCSHQIACEECTRETYRHQAGAGALRCPMCRQTPQAIFKLPQHPAPESNCSSRSNSVSGRDVAAAAAATFGAGAAAGSGVRSAPPHPRAAGASSPNMFARFASLDAEEEADNLPACFSSAPSGRDSPSSLASLSLSSSDEEERKESTAHVDSTPHSFPLHFARTEERKKQNQHAAPLLGALDADDPSISSLSQQMLSSNDDSPVIDLVYTYEPVEPSAPFSPSLEHAALAAAGDLAAPKDQHLPLPLPLYPSLVADASDPAIDQTGAFKVKHAFVDDLD
jgi:hypothetical protein